MKSLSRQFYMITLTNITSDRNTNSASEKFPCQNIVRNALGYIETILSTLQQLSKYLNETLQQRCN